MHICIKYVSVHFPSLLYGLARQKHSLMSGCSPWISSTIDAMKNITVKTEDGQVLSYAADFFHLECVDGKWLIVENLTTPPPSPIPPLPTPG